VRGLDGGSDCGAESAAGVGTGRREQRLRAGERGSRSRAGGRIALALVLASLGAGFVSMAVRYPSEMRWAARPLPLRTPFVEEGLALGALLGALTLLWSERRGLRCAGASRTLQLFLLYPPLFGLLWLSPRDSPLPALLAVGWCLPLAVGAWGMSGLWRKRERVGLTLRRFLPAGRRLALPTALVLLVTALGLVAVHARPRQGLFVERFLTYPLYAAGQLAVFLVLPLQLLRPLGVRGRHRLWTAVALFAFAHWPNAPLVVITATALWFWGRIYLRQPSLAALALSMGLLATFVSFLRAGWMVVGPNYVAARALNSWP